MELILPTIDAIFT